MMYRHKDFPDLGQEARLARQEEDRARSCSLVEVAKALGVTAPRARQIEHAALQHFAERLALLMAVRGLTIADLLADDSMEPPRHKLYRPR